MRVGIVGVSGYSGMELLRLLGHHPEVEISYAAGQHDADAPLSEMFPFMRALSKVRYSRYEEALCADACDVVFVALPSGVSGQIAAGLWGRGKRVIDLSGDLRLPADVYTTWYRKQPVAADVVAQAVYGLPELYREAIAHSDLVSNPGCYATTVLLGLLPAIRSGLWDGQGLIISDAKSGVSGAGRSPATNTLSAELSENFYPYRVGNHQHIPEIERHLFGADGGTLLLTTQLLPVVRGIYASSYVPLAPDVTQEAVDAAYADFYRDEPFVGVRTSGVPELKHVRASNMCHVRAVVDARSHTLQVFSALDNLQKGAAGQAIQNLNIMCGWPETSGLPLDAVYP